jgi:hypothetical protein
MKVLDIALGLEYLHNVKPTVIHGDLKGVSFPRHNASIFDGNIH